MIVYVQKKEPGECHNRDTRRITVAQCGKSGKRDGPPYTYPVRENTNRRFPEKEVSVLFVSSAVRAAFFIIGLLIIMYQIIPLRPAIEIILDASGILALCAAFAARESFGNYIAGFLLTVHKPFKIGDRISLQQIDITGTVKDISFRHTVIESDSGSIITVPNSIMNTVAIEDLPEIKPKRQNKKKK